MSARLSVGTLPLLHAKHTEKLAKVNNWELAHQANVRNDRRPRAACPCPQPELGNPACPAPRALWSDRSRALASWAFANGRKASGAMSSHQKRFRGRVAAETQTAAKKRETIKKITSGVGLCSPKCSTYISHHQVTGGRALYSIDSPSTQTPTRVRRKSTPSSPPPDESPRDTYQKHTRTHTCTLLMSLARACTLYSGCMAFVCTCLRACDFSASRARLARRAWAISIQPASSIDASVSALCVAAYDAHALAQWFWK